jgi:hypothetical protein
VPGVILGWITVFTNNSGTIHKVIGGSSAVSTVKIIDIVFRCPLGSGVVDHYVLDFLCPLSAVPAGMKIAILNNVHGYLPHKKEALRPHLPYLL